MQCTAINQQCTMYKCYNSAMYNNMLHTKSSPENLPNEPRKNDYPFNRA